MLIKKGDIFWADLSPTVGSEQAGMRPVLIIQNDIGNQFGDVTIVAAVTSKIFSKEYLTNVVIPKGTGNLKMDSTVMLNQIRTLDKSRLKNKIGHLSSRYLDKVNTAIQFSLGLDARKGSEKFE